MSKKTDIFHLQVFKSYILRVTIFMRQKAKTPKDILGKKVSAAATLAVVPILQFLQTKKQKDIHNTNLTSC